MNSALFLVASALSLSAAETVTLPLLSETPSLVDGMLTDGCWSKAYKVRKFLPIRPDQAPVAERTEALVFATKSHLYVGFVAYVKDARDVNGQAADAKLGAWGADHLEIFMDPGDSGNEWQFAFAVNGAVAGDRQNRCRFGVQLYEDRYQIEIEIPLDYVPLKPAAFKPEWRLNLCRATKGGEYTSWAKLTSGTFHETESFLRVAGIDYDLAALLKRQQALTKSPLELKVVRRITTEATVKVVAETTPKAVGQTLELSVTNRAGAVVWKGSFPRTGEKTELTVPITGLADGRYRLEADLVGPAARCHAGADFWKIPPKRAKPAINFTCRDRAIYKNGEFFFPLVVWGGSVGWGEFKNHRFDTNAFFRCYHRRLAEMRDLGFNATLTCSSDMPDLARLALKGKRMQQFFAAWDPYREIAQLPLDFKEVCRLHAEHGLAMMPYLHIWHPAIGDEVDAWLVPALQWREADNILCWHLSDEMDGGIENNNLLNKNHHEVDPDRLTWVNCIQGIVANRDNADILSTDPYPIPHGSVTTVGYHAKRVFETCRPNQSPWLWVQMFGGEGGWTRAPTFTELKSMVFIALNHGVRAICYFNYYPSKVQRDGIHTMTEADYAKLGPFNRRLEVLAKTYCLGENLARTFDEKTLADIAVFRHDGAILASVVNGDKTRRRIRCELPKGVPAAGEASVKGENRTIRYRGGAIEEDFEPLAVRLYWIKP